MNWLPYIFFAAACWALHNIFIKLLGETVPPALAATLFYAVALLTTASIYFIAPPLHKFEISQLYNTKIIITLIMAGITIGLVDFLYVTSLSKGAPLTLAGPLFSTIGLALIALSGVLFFSESLNATKALGFLLAGISVFLLTK